MISVSSIAPFSNRVLKCLHYMVISLKSPIQVKLITVFSAKQNEIKLFIQSITANLLNLKEEQLFCIFLILNKCHEIIRTNNVLVLWFSDPSPLVATEDVNL